MLERYVNAIAKRNPEAAKAARVLIKRFGDEPLTSAATPVEAPKTLSRDQLILPSKELPQEVSDILKRAEKAGITSLEAYHLSGVTLTQGSQVEGWTKKPENWYWEQIKNGKISPDAPKLPGSWVLLDNTQKPNYEDGKQMYKKDPFGPLLAKLRKDNKIQKIKHIPEDSRFGISPDELRTIVLPEIANLMGVNKSQVRLPKEIEFNVIGNFKHQKWGETNTWEWLEDNFGGADRLIGGDSDDGGLTYVSHYWSGYHIDGIGFRPLVVVSSKA